MRCSKQLPSSIVIRSGEVSRTQRPKPKMQLEERLTGSDFTEKHTTAEYPRIRGFADASPNDVVLSQSFGSSMAQMRPSEAHSNVVHCLQALEARATAAGKINVFRAQTKLILYHSPRAQAWIIRASRGYSISGTHLQHEHAL